MNIQPINSYTQLNTVKNQVSFKDYDGELYSDLLKTPYQKAIEEFDRKFYVKLQKVEETLVDSKQRAKALDKLWAQKEKGEIAIKERYGIIKKRNFIQKLLNLK